MKGVRHGRHHPALRLASSAFRAHRAHPPPPARPTRPRRAGAQFLVPLAVGGAVRGTGRRPGTGHGVPRAYVRLPGRRRPGHRHLPDQRPGRSRGPARLLRRPGHRKLARGPLGADRHSPHRDRAAARTGRTGPHSAGRRPGGRRRLRADERRRRSRRRTPAPGHRHRRGGRAGRGDPPRGRGGARPAHPGARADPAGGRPGHLRTAGRRRRARARHRRERAGQPDRTGPARGAADRPARHQRPPRGRGEGGRRRHPDRDRGGPQGPPGPRGRRGRARDGAARAEAQAAWLRVHGEVAPGTLHALAATRLAENLPRIESITLSPDVLTGLLGRLGRPEGGSGA